MEVEEEFIESTVSMKQYDDGCVNIDSQMDQILAIASHVDEQNFEHELENISSIIQQILACKQRICINYQTLNRIQFLLKKFSTNSKLFILSSLLPLFVESSCLDSIFDEDIIRYFLDESNTTDNIIDMIFTYYYHLIDRNASVISIFRNLDINSYIINQIQIKGIQIQTILMKFLVSYNKLNNNIDEIIEMEQIIENIMTSSLMNQNIELTCCCLKFYQSFYPNLSNFPNLIDIIVTFIFDHLYTQDPDVKVQFIQFLIFLEDRKLFIVHYTSYIRLSEFFSYFSIDNHELRINTCIFFIRIFSINPQIANVCVMEQYILAVNDFLFNGTRELKIAAAELISSAILNVTSSEYLKIFVHDELIDALLEFDSVENSDLIHLHTNPALMRLLLETDLPPEMYQLLSDHLIDEPGDSDDLQENQSKVNEIEKEEAEFSEYMKNKALSNT